MEYTKSIILRTEADLPRSEALIRLVRQQIIVCAHNHSCELPAIYQNNYGPIAVALINRFGCRLVASAGAVTAACSFLLCAVMRDMNALICTFGLIGD
ncbi:unnamed protein product [Calicophoron daubneyi]|uniref:Uncharacterized protein n=1 Tax=Calicophoron daubneyi TaxID=300641 RepID=A0AAV2T2A7_CALDB